MNKVIGILIAVFTLSGCGTTLTAAQRTGNEGEYVVTSTHNYSVFSSLEKAKENAASQAADTCSKMGKVYKENYSIDHGIGIGQVVESTLYFNCVDKS